MQRADAMRQQRGMMLLRAIPFVFIKTVLRELLGDFSHHAVARYFGDDGRRGNAADLLVAFDDAMGPQAQLANADAVHQQQFRTRL